MGLFPFLARMSQTKVVSPPSASLGIPLGRFRGIRILLDPSWFVIVILMTMTLYIRWREFTAIDPPGYVWLSAAVSSLAFFVCVLVHEFTHSLVAQARGIGVEGIVLFIFGGVSRLRSEPTKPKDEVLIAGVGPLASVVIGGVFYLAWALVPETMVLTRVALRWLGSVNLLLAAFNLLPAFPLDGGRVLRASVWILSGSLKRATRVATRVGTTLAYVLMAFGVVLMFVPAGFLSGLWVAFIGWFLLSAAQASVREAGLREALGRRRVHQAMRPVGPPSAPTDTVETFVERRLLGSGERSAFVAGDGIVGWVTLQEVKRLDRDRWEETTLQQIMVPLGDVVSVKRADSLLSAMEKMGAHGLDQLPVVEDGELMGVVTREDLLRVAAIDLELEETREI